MVTERSGFNWEGWVPVARVPDMHARVETLARRGCVVTVEVTDETEVWENPEYAWNKVEVVKVVLRAEDMVTEEGWGFEGYFSTEDGVRLGGRDIFGDDEAEWTRCDHCGHDRDRKQAFALRHEDGRTMVVGSTCVKDFTGWNPMSVMPVVRFFEGFADPDDDFGGLGWPTPRVPTLDWVTVALAAVRTIGWVSKAKADGWGRVSTAEVVHSHFFPPRGYEVENTVSIPEGTREEAEQAIAWVDQQGRERWSDDFWATMGDVAAAEAVTPRLEGFASCIAMVWDREVEQRAERKAREEERSDVPESVTKGRHTVRGTVVSRKTKENAYGVRIVLTVAMEDGWVGWGTAPSGLKRVEEGTVVEFTARFEVSDRDSTFSFWSRPTKASVVEVAA